MSTTIQIRLPEDLKASLQARADAECRTLSNLVRQVVEQSHYEYLVRSKVEAARLGNESPGKRPQNTVWSRSQEV